jgi:HJR/Mrr/RecB family endonuclease
MSELINDDPYARSKADELVASVKLDAKTNTVSLRYKGEPKVMFSTLSDLACALKEIADTLYADGWDSMGTYMDGDGYLLYPGARHYIDGALRESGIQEFFERRDYKQEREQLYKTALSIPLPSVVRVEFADITEELIRYLASHPEKMYELNPYKFEDLVAEIFRDRGYDVIQTPYSKDDGRDLLAVYKEPFGTILTLVECKRYAAHQRIGPALVRHLFGVVEHERASHGILATTSFFTKGAREWTFDLQYKLSLHDYNDVVAWCREYRRPK